MTGLRFSASGSHNGDTVTVEHQGVLWWSGYDAGGEVVVALGLADDIDPDKQVWTCG